MPTLTLQDKVQDYVGTVTDTNALSSWLANGVRILTNLIPEHKAYKYSADTAVTTAGLSVVDKRVLKAHKNSYGCRLVDPKYKAQVQDTNSLHYANSTDPVMLLENGKIYIYPDGGSVSAITYPTVLYTTETPIANFPEELEDALVLRTALRWVYSKLSTAISTISTLSVSVETPPTVPEIPVFAFNNVAVDLDTSYTDATYTGATYTNALTDVIASTTISSLATAPAYTKITTPTISFTNADAFINTDEDVELANAELSQIKTKLENFQMEMYNELNEFNSQSLEYNAELQKKIKQAELDQQRLIAESQLQIQLNQSNAQQAVATALSNAQQTGNIDAINKAKALETSIFNKAKEIEIAIINKTKDLESQIAQYSSSLQKYQSELQGYGVAVNESIANFGATIQQNNAEIQSYIPLIQSLKTEYNEILQGFING